MKKVLNVVLSSILLLILFVNFDISTVQAKGIGSQNQFLNNLLDKGYGEIGAYSVTQMKKNVFHIHDATLSNPAGFHADGTFNNPASMYIIVDKDKALLIDGGNAPTSEKANDFKQILSVLTKGKTLEVAITHNHGDHIGMLAEKVIPTSTKVYLPRTDYTENTASKISAYTNIQLVNDGDEIKLDKYKFKVIGVAGHTDGSVAYVDYKNEIIATGDCIGSAFVWLMFTDNALKTFDASVRNLYNEIKDFKKPIFLPGHHWQLYFKGRTAGEMNLTYVKDMVELMDGIKDGTAYVDVYTDRGLPGDIKINLPGNTAEIDTTETLLQQFRDSLR
jgi:glyoxylase-like metal-dependent hydrolase (beta-lactamase superfamily II)